MPPKRHLGSLAKDVYKIARVIIPREVLKVKKQVSRDVLNTAIRKTRVDTSQARSNWQVSLNQDDGNKIDAHFPGKRASTIAPSTAMSLKLGREKIKTVGKNDTVFVYNNLNYIQKLDSDPRFNDQMEINAIKKGELTADKMLRKMKIDPKV